MLMLMLVPHPTHVCSQILMACIPAKIVCSQLQQYLTAQSITHPSAYAAAIAVMAVPDKGLGSAINDRLRRATAERPQ